MLPSPFIVLSPASLLPLTFSAPSPRRGGGGFGSLGGSSHGSSEGLALAGLAGVIVANSGNGYSLDGDPAPNAGYDGSTTCTYSGGNVTNTLATSPTWISNMTGCLNALAADDWSGTECAPAVGGAKFGFYKGENDYDDAVDCYQRCEGCLSAAINASQAVTTRCQYEYRTLRDIAGYKTHTCTMGYDAQT